MQRKNNSSLPLENHPIFGNSYALKADFTISPQKELSSYVLYFAFWAIVLPWLQTHGVNFWIKFSDFIHGSFNAALVIVFFNLSFYWVHSFLLSLIDLFPSIRNRLRITKLQDDKYISFSTYLTVCKTVLFNQIFVTLPMGIIYSYWICYCTKINEKADALDLSKTLYQLSIFLILEEVLFYYTHRFLHNPYVYKIIHKKHHELTAPIGLAAIYAHPFEHIFSNMIPLFVGPVLCKSHPLLTFSWFTIASINTINSHSGYIIGIFPNPINHDWHHYSFNENFGLLGVMDYIHGTDRKYKSLLNSRKNRC